MESNLGLGYYLKNTVNIFKRRRYKMINISNSTVQITITEDTVSKEKDKLLRKLYFARNKSTMGGYAAWQELLHMYYMGNYQGMKEFINSCRGKGGKTRNECIKSLDIIMGGIKK
jgi:hypothetical protein